MPYMCPKHHRGIRKRPRLPPHFPTTVTEACRRPTFLYAHVLVCWAQDTVDVTLKSEPTQWHVTHNTHTLCTCISGFKRWKLAVHEPLHVSLFTQAIRARPRPALRGLITLSNSRTLFHTGSRAIKCPFPLVMACRLIPVFYMTNNATINHLTHTFFLKLLDCWSEVWVI